VSLAKRREPSAWLLAGRRTLIVKHALFALLYGGGTLWLFSLVR
jgi:hypothetical protein